MHLVASLDKFALVAVWANWVAALSRVLPSGHFKHIDLDTILFDQFGLLGLLPWMNINYQV